jgi:hypothetical protein
VPGEPASGFTGRAYPSSDRIVEARRRYLKPVEYAQAGVRRFWRIERDGAATVHMFGLGAGADGTPVYVARGAALLEDLLAGPVPDLDD